MSILVTTAQVTFGESLRIYRARTGVSQQELADKAGVSRNYISLIERDKASDLSLSVLIRVVEATGMALKIELRAKEAHTKDFDL